MELLKQTICILGGISYMHIMLILLKHSGMLLALLRILSRTSG